MACAAVGSAAGTAAGATADTRWRVTLGALQTVCNGHRGTPGAACSAARAMFNLLHLQLQPVNQLSSTTLCLLCISSGCLVHCIVSRLHRLGLNVGNSLARQQYVYSPTNWWSAVDLGTYFKVKFKSFHYRNDINETLAKFVVADVYSRLILSETKYSCIPFASAPAPI